MAACSVLLRSGAGPPLVSLIAQFVAAATVAVRLRMTTSKSRSSQGAPWTPMTCRPTPPSRQSRARAGRGRAVSGEEADHHEVHDDTGSMDQCETAQHEFKLHDFRFQGISSVESAQLGMAKEKPK